MNRLTAALFLSTPPPLTRAPLACDSPPRRAAALTAPGLLPRAFLQESSLMPEAISQQ